MNTCDLCGTLYLAAGLDVPPIHCRVCEATTRGDFAVLLRVLTDEERAALRAWLDAEPAE